MHEVVFGEDRGGQRFGQMLGDMRQEGGGEAGEGLGVDAAVLGLLGGAVDGKESMGGTFVVEGGSLDIRVCHLEGASIERGLAHDVIDSVGAQHLFNPLEALKPDEGHGAGAVGEGGFESGGAARSDGVEVADAAAEDEIGLVGVELVNGAYA